ncbi:MAG: hypothetical protein WC419_06370 [Candidatus Omnitrophota bacterium]|jgi:hypothetical protein|nr:hypothetical protein [Candidatus Omnitrophota bacterium]
MKKLLLVVLALMLVSSVSFAQSADKKAPSPAKEIAKGIENVGEFVGKVVSVTVADPAKGVREGTIKVADSMGNPVSYTVNSAATIVDASFNAITLNQLKEGSMVKVKAEKAKNGKEEAKAISVM